jgi:hypothetical protein
MLGVPGSPSPGKDRSSGIVIDHASCSFSHVSVVRFDRDFRVRVSNFFQGGRRLLTQWVGPVGQIRIVNVTAAPAILRAFDPSRAVMCE